MSSSPVEATKPSLTERVQRSPLGPPIRTLVSWTRVPLWRRAGGPAPAPPHVKRAMVTGEVERHHPKVFVETGTYRGDTLADVARIVDRAISIELDPTLADLARHRLRRRSNVEIITGDSARCLPEIVAALDEPAVFWLDGHYSDGVTADGGSSPILAEIDTVLSAPFDHVVLIDDMRLFDGTDGYPTLDVLRQSVAARRADWVFEVIDDIARVYAKR